MVAAATLTATRLPLGLAATPHYIHEILGVWGLIRGGWYCRGVPRGVPKGALAPLSTQTYTGRPKLKL